MSLGLCCQWLALKNNKPKNLLVSRTLQLGRFRRGEYSQERVKQTYVDNLENLLKLLPVIIESGIRSFRVSSSMFPLHDKVDQSCYDNDQVLQLLSKIGSLVRSNGIRVTTHPGQFTVLSSDNPDTVNNSITELNHHGWLFDKMGLDASPYYSINIHGGKSNRADQLARAIERLEDSARNRLTLENCEFGYSVADLLPVSGSTGVPICFDSHHHKFRTGKLDGEAALAAAMQTWPDGIRPNTHVSNSKAAFSPDAPATKLRQHSDYLRNIPNYQLALNNAGLIDIDVEAKMKNLAIFEAVSELGAVL